MTVYGEVLFLENAVSGAIILILTGKMRGCPPLGKWRAAAGAVMCGAYAFVLFVDMSWLVALLSKLVFSLAVVVTVFGAPTWRALLKTAGAFYIISFLMGGVTIALMYMLKLPFMTANGSFVLKGATFIQIAAGVTATYILGSWLAGLLREKARKEAVIKNVIIHIGNYSWEVNALIDTGNSLREPVSGHPVAVVSRQLGARIKEELEDEADKRICIIPYKTVGGRGLLYGIRPDCIAVDGEMRNNIILGISEGNFSPWKGSEEYEILLHQQLFEGEDNDDQEHSHKAEHVGTAEGMDKEVL